MRDIARKTYNRLTAQWPVGKQGRNILWLCLCSCGSLHLVQYSGLTRLDKKRVQSCGCLNKESHLKHGHSVGGKRSREFNTWHAMMQRCFNPNNKNYKDYGGRGITVCPRWVRFENFLNDMGVKPRGLTIERKNNNKGYSPSNCMWATWTQQAHNKRNME